MTLGLGTVLLLAVVALTLTRSPPRVVRVGETTGGEFAYTTHALEVCQPNEVLPAGVTGIRMSLEAYFGTKVSLRVLSGSQILTKGRRGPDWTSRTVTVPVAPLSHSVSHVKLCVEVGPTSEAIFFAGRRTPTQESARSTAGEPLGGRIGVEYLAAGQSSWWSLILTVARHMGLGHALSGTWVVLLIAALMAAVGLLAAGLTLRELQ
jgi:hypothetical protein